MRKGRLLVLSAPSGCGKTTILRQVMQNLEGLVFSVSHTTRSPRPGEQDGVHYYFVSREAFLALRNRGGFLESAEVHGKFYGTGREEVARLQALGSDVILDIDVQGARQVMAVADPVTVFIAPPSLEELERRLRERQTESEEAIKLRLENGRHELKAAGEYQYMIVNDQLAQAVEELRAIIIAERLRQHRPGV
ncbi:MAG: guanylate kinase [Desulfobulbus propionicus]|nr:MAG: guanylate kinase [Desulfobulbus propionicus]